MSISKIAAIAKAVGGGSVSPEAIASAVSDWLGENVDPDTGYVIDDSLTIADAAADAKKVGDELTDLKSAFEVNAYA